MKKSRLEQIIREEHNAVHGKKIITEESLITKILALILSPKVKKEVAKIKKTPEYIELEQQATLAIKELEAINKKLERVYADRVDLEKEAKKIGIKGYRQDMDYFELRALFGPIYKKLGKHNI